MLRAASAMQGLRRGSDGLWHQGVSFWRTDELASAISRSAGAGLQVAQHALGNEAVAQALDAIERPESHPDAAATMAMPPAPPAPPRPDGADTDETALVTGTADTDETAVVASMVDTAET